MEDMDKIVVPFLSRKLVHGMCSERLEISEKRTLVEFGLTVGHLGVSDQFVGLHHLIDTGEVRPGGHVLLVGVGLGFTWTAAVVQITGLASGT